MRSFKAMGLALVAVFAMSAIAATAASANQFHSTATNTTQTIFSNEAQKFTYETGGKTINCSTIGGEGKTTAQTTTEVTFKPTYSGCQVEGIFGASAEVSMNECDYTFHIEAAANEGATDVKCPTGKQITITIKVFGVSICTLHITEQTPAGKSKYANEGTTKIKVQPTQTGISGTRQGSAECGAATSTTGSYTGTAIVKGEESGTTNEKAIQVG